MKFMGSGSLGRWEMKQMGPIVTPSPMEGDGGAGRGGRRRPVIWDSRNPPHPTNVPTPGGKIATGYEQALDQSLAMTKGIDGRTIRGARHQIHELEKDSGRANHTGTLLLLY